MNDYKVSLAAARVNAGLTQQEVAKKLHCSKTSITNWETGRIIPSHIVVKALCSLYEAPVEAIRLQEEQEA